MEENDVLRIGSVVINCEDFDRTVGFWSEALGYQPRTPADGDWVVLRDPSGRGPNLSVQGTPELKLGRNRMHLDLYAVDAEAEVERLVGLGATVRQARREGTDFTILADPEGKLFCVVQLPAPPGGDPG